MVSGTRDTKTMGPDKGVSRPRPGDSRHVDGGSRRGCPSNSSWGLEGHGRTMGPDEGARLPRLGDSRHMDGGS